jgi:hypothetical protein
MTKGGFVKANLAALACCFSLRQTALSLEQAFSLGEKSGREDRGVEAGVDRGYEQMNYGARSALRIVFLER